MRFYGTGIRYPRPALSTTQYVSRHGHPAHRYQPPRHGRHRSFCLQWKNHYILDGCTPGEKYVWFEGTKGSNICVSEGQGYGMMIVALMAGFDSTAQDTYDCLYRYYRSHPSTTSSDLMAWMQ